MRRLILTGLFLATGCAERQTPPAVAAPKPLAIEASATTLPPATSDARPTTAPSAKPFVMHLPGVAGISGIDYSLRDGLKAGGFDGQVEIYDWTCNDPGIPALHNRARNEAQAAIVAEKLTRQFRDHPEQPIFLICHSGGSGPATWALERLPSDVKVSCYVMLAPALSPTYDLSRALAHVAKAYCFQSVSDDLVLGTGTKMFGTIDGQRCDAAGRVGFEKPLTATDPGQYAKLISKPYDSDWVRFGHIGGHMGWMGMTFAEAVVAPAMLGRAVNERVTNRNAHLTPDVLWPK
jgi:hypothetical protein